MQQDGQGRTQNAPREADPAGYCPKDGFLHQHPHRSRQTRLHHLLQAPALKVVLAHVPLVARFLPQLGGLAREEDGRPGFVEDEIGEDCEGGRDGEHDPVDGAEAFNLSEVAEADWSETGAKGCKEKGGRKRGKKGGRSRRRQAISMVRGRRRCRVDLRCESTPSEPSHRRSPVLIPPHIAQRPSYQRHRRRARNARDEARNEDRLNVLSKCLREEEEGEDDGGNEVDRVATVDFGERGEE
jgi:hypothetical protein